MKSADTSVCWILQKDAGSCRNQTFLAFSVTHDKHLNLASQLFPKCPLETEEIAQTQHLSIEFPQE